MHLAPYCSSSMSSSPSASLQRPARRRRLRGEPVVAHITSIYHCCLLVYHVLLTVYASMS